MLAPWRSTGRLSPRPDLVGWHLFAIARPLALSLGFLIELSPTGLGSA